MEQALENTMDVLGVSADQAEQFNNVLSDLGLIDIAPEVDTNLSLIHILPHSEPYCPFSWRHRN